jgi:hypothetical protein
MINWKERARASGIHLGVCLAIAAVAGLLVLGLWYPYPYREIAGGRELFFLVVTVDVAIGPLLTLAVFDRRKPIGVLRRDLAVIGLLQAAALAYGLWSVALARPVHLVFEIDRFRVVREVDVPEVLLMRAPAELRAMPWSGPTLLAVRPFRSADEKIDATIAELQGVPVGVRPDLWEPYDAARPRVLQAAKPVGELKARLRARAAEIDAVLRSAHRNPESVAYLPLVGRDLFWTAFVDPVSADVIAFMPLDPY